MIPKYSIKLSIMKLFAKGLILIVFLSVIQLNVSAQLHLNAEYRPLTELRHGYKSPVNKEADAAFLTSHRARLNAEYNAARFNLGLSIQDVRVWGNTTQLNTSDNLTSFHQAWAEVLVNKEWSVKLGRQELNYDDGRLFGNVNWLQQARSHDLALLKYTGNGLKAHLGLAFNQEKDQLTGTLYMLNNYKAMQFLWLNKNFGNTGVSVYLINNGYQYENPDTAKLDYSVNYTQTIGARASHKAGNLTLAGAVYGQTGKDQSGREVSAYYLNLEAAYVVSSNLRGTLGAEILSGTDADHNTIKDDNKSFTPLYGTAHKFNGHMDYFYAANHFNNVGLNDVYLKITQKSGKLLLGADLHAFMANASVFDLNGTKMEKYLGTEIDAWAEFQIDEAVLLSGGYSMMFATDAMKAVKKVSGDIGTQYWGWVMLTFKPNLLKQ